MSGILVFMLKRSILALGLKWARFGGHTFSLMIEKEVSPMPKTRPPYPPEFRQQLVDLVLAGRSPEDLAKEFEPSAVTIRNWVVQAKRDGAKSPTGLS